MTASFKESREYKASAERVFRACRDAIQPCGLSIVELDQESRTIKARSTDSQFDSRPDASLSEDIGNGIMKLFVSFGETVMLSVDDDGTVNAESVSFPRTIQRDYGRNKKHIGTIWTKLDEYLMHSRGTVHDNSVTITGNSAPVQNASPGARQYVGVSGDRDDYRDVKDRAQEILADLLSWRSLPERWTRIERIVIDMRTALEKNDMGTFEGAAGALALTSPSKKEKAEDASAIPPPENLRFHVSRLVHSLGGEH